MQNPRIASRYAKSLLDIASETGQLEVVLEDMKTLDAACRDSEELKVMLASPVIHADKKLAVMHEIFKDRVSDLSLKFFSLMVAKGRETFLQETAVAYISQYAVLKHITKVTLKTASPLNGETKDVILSKIAAIIPDDSIELNTVVDESLIGGFVFEVGDNFYDASVRKRLMDMRSGIIDTSYVPKI